jgi:hypothetical protein
MARRVKYNSVNKVAIPPERPEFDLIRIVIKYDAAHRTADVNAVSVFRARLDIMCPTFGVRGGSLNSSSAACYICMCVWATTGAVKSRLHSKTLNFPRLRLNATARYYGTRAKANIRNQMDINRFTPLNLTQRGTMRRT